MCAPNTLRVRIISIMSFVVAVITVVKMSMDLHGGRGSGKYAVLVGLDVREFFPGTNETDEATIFASPHDNTELNHFVLFCLVYALLDAACCISLFVGSINMNFLTIPPYILIKGLNTIIQVVAFMYYVIEGNHVKADVVIHALANLALTVICTTLVIDSTKGWVSNQVPYRRAVNEDEATEMAHFTPTTEADGSSPAEVMETTNVGADEPSEATEMMHFTETTEAGESSSHDEVVETSNFGAEKPSEALEMLPFTQTTKADGSSPAEVMETKNVGAEEPSEAVKEVAETVEVATQSTENGENSPENQESAQTLEESENNLLVESPKQEDEQEIKIKNDTIETSGHVIEEFADDMIPLISDESSESSNEEDKQCEEKATRLPTVDFTENSSGTVENKAKQPTEDSNVTNEGSGQVTEEVETSNSDFGVAELTTEASTLGNGDEAETAV